MISTYIFIYIYIYIYMFILKYVCVCVRLLFGLRLLGFFGGKPKRKTLHGSPWPPCRSPRLLPQIQGLRALVQAPGLHLTRRRGWLAIGLHGPILVTHIHGPRRVGPKHVSMAHQIPFWGPSKFPVFLFPLKRLGPIYLRRSTL